MFSGRLCFISSYRYAKYSVGSCGLEKTCRDGDGKDERVSEKTLGWSLVLMTSDGTDGIRENLCPPRQAWVRVLAADHSTNTVSWRGCQGRPE